MGPFAMFFLGLLYANFMEWFVHRFLFHGLGKNKKSIFAFHLREHHIIARKNHFVDKSVTIREFLGIVGLVLSHLPLHTVYGWTTFYMAIVIYGGAFLALHKLQHCFPKLAKRYYWWHWNHHMSNQNKSWCVVHPFTDMILGTLEERKDES